MIQQSSVEERQESWWSYGTSLFTNIVENLQVRLAFLIEHMFSLFVVSWVWKMSRPIALHGKPISELQNITCCMEPPRWMHLAFTPTRQANTRFTDPGWMEGWVYVGGFYIPRWVAYSKTCIHSGANWSWRRATTPCFKKTSHFVIVHIFAKYWLTDFKNSP